MALICLLPLNHLKQQQVLDQQLGWDLQPYLFEFHLQKILEQLIINGMSMLLVITHIPEQN